MTDKPVESQADRDELTEIFFYLDPKTMEIVDVLCFGPATITYRWERDWEPVTLADSGLREELANCKKYKYIWETDEVEMTPDFDFDDYDLVNPTIVKNYDKGTIHLSDILECCIEKDDKRWIEFFERHPFG